ncbi:low molecular weight protein-tyrosine-phosphatase [Campylobacter sp. MIT 97-5078]|uniref:low molecular weight protein-tyrosine-phosphatase n=1 Tax=Campylobacter sp. MIT 97-5078 TaxID=1548153 RepID=UPI000513563A|nr:low molecular weight protein-tyrosine-phosphatase [Campylobacter sp. MIT 97-5078]KGI55902.1 hypothetical protein LR59_09920 [Campylobacter sp. MIT 97-5078]KGI57784.1 hypothetical protein LR59_03680 [Campylobacter sp. MIT 97-5078]TQR23077.1 low molecular weight phosphotyrosine protein phosphatase [Campylobacter sp. MIT 97-5078]
MNKICFVCLGNICRSPMAEFVMKNLAQKYGLNDKLNITSAGTAGYHDGEDMDKRTKKKLSEKGINATHFISKKLTQKLCDESKLLLVMDKMNYKAVQSNFKGLENKLFYLLDFCENTEKEIPDPYYTNTFEECHELILKACEGLCKYLKQKL